jgi:hypothetical protein
MRRNPGGLPSGCEISRNLQCIFGANQREMGVPKRVDAYRRAPGRGKRFFGVNTLYVTDGFPQDRLAPNRGDERRNAPKTRRRLSPPDCFRSGRFHLVYRISELTKPGDAIHPPDESDDDDCEPYKPTSITSIPPARAITSRKRWLRDRD